MPRCSAQAMLSGDVCWLARSSKRTIRQPRQWARISDKKAWWVIRSQTFVISNWTSPGPTLIAPCSMRFWRFPVIGTRTWGGLIGITGSPPLVDDGSITVPTFGIYNPKSEWIIEAVVEQLRVARTLLKAGGRVVVLQPNVRLVGGAYWDFIDHSVMLTERSLVEAGELAGLRTVELIVRFLPYTTKSRLPQSPRLVRAYLGFRPAWRLLGKQTLYVGGK